MKSAAGERLSCSDLQPFPFYGKGIKTQTDLGTGKCRADRSKTLPETFGITESETSDHGCDPATSSTDHSGEYIPLLVYGKGIKDKAKTDLGTGKCYADRSKTLPETFGITESETADHGCDPATPSTDHSGEYIRSSFTEKVSRPKPTSAQENATPTGQRPFPKRSA